MIGAGKGGFTTMPEETIAIPRRIVEELLREAIDVLPVLRAVAQGYDYNPGSSDLDDEQPIHVRMTLGDYRRAVRLQYSVEGAQ
jgi:hypothetical protein